MVFVMNVERIHRIIQCIIVILATALVFYLVLTEERFGLEGYGCCEIEAIISDAQAELGRKKLK